MNEDNTNRLNLFDFFGFPDCKLTEESQQICDIHKLLLLPVGDNILLFCNTYFEQYSAWCNHINNFSTHLWLHFLLMYYQHFKNPYDTITIEKFQSPQTAHKIFFDIFAEDVSLYLISYIDKHLEMFNDLYNLKELSGKKHKLSRNAIINEMKKVEMLKELANEYQNVEQSLAFHQIKTIRNSFVHNKSLSYYGMDVQKIRAGVYASVSNRGISTELTYKSVCELFKSYGQLCQQVNAFIKIRKEEAGYMRKSNKKIEK